MDQLGLDLVLPPRFGRADFLPAPANAAALAFVESWPEWPDRLALVCGPHGAGKSHLAAIWAERAGAEPVVDLTREGWHERLPEAMVLDDADRIAAPEAALFHLLNLVRERRGWLLMTSALPPDRWGLHTPDLLSRLRLAPVVQLGAPDDALMGAVLLKLFADRQIAVEENLIAYLVPRLSRSLGDARAAVDVLDRAALAEGVRVTRTMAARLLGGLDLDEEEG